MNYETFGLAWRDGLWASGLQGVHSEQETIDLRSLDRCRQGWLEPHVGQDAEPWFVTARVAWRWSSLQSARTATREEDLLTELFGDSGEATTEPAWLRVDVELLATLPFGSAFPVPEAALLRAWSREVIGRLQAIEPLLPSPAEAAAFGGLVGPGWLGTPALGAQCAPDGRLVIERVSLASWQPLNLPRIFDDPDRADEPPDLGAFFARLRAALYVWMECLDHLGLRAR